MSEIVHNSSSEVPSALASTNSTLPSVLRREWLYKGVVNEEFTIMQFNCLADGLAQTGNFAFCSPEELEWQFRWTLMKQEISKVDPDVLCVQEMNHPEMLAQFMPTHYMVFCPKLSSPALHCGAPPDGCVMLLRRSLFKLVDVQIMYYNTEHSLNSGAIIVSVKDKRNKQGFVFATTHLKAKESFEEIRIVQIQQLLARIKGSRMLLSSLLSERNMPHKFPKVILTGDFNSDPHRDVYRLIYEDKDLCFESVYNSISPLLPSPRASASANASAFDGDVEREDLSKIRIERAEYAKHEPLFTTFKKRGFGLGLESKLHTIDYIWVSNEQTSGAKLIQGALLSIPSEADIGDQALPCKRYPSDHLAIAAKLGWNRLI